MKPKPIPDDFDGWEQLPTFEELLKRTGFKIQALRSRLQGVTCYRCPDKSVRYMQDEADQALEEEDEEAAVLLDTNAKDPLQVLGALVKVSMGVIHDFRRERHEIVSTLLRPFELGLEHNKRLLESVIAENAEHRNNAREMFLAMQTMLDRSQERDLRVEDRRATREYRREAFAMARTELPKALDLAVALTQMSSDRAKAAMAAISALDPEMLRTLAESDALDDRARERFRALYEQLHGSGGNQRGEAAE